MEFFNRYVVSIRYLVGGILFITAAPSVMNTNRIFTDKISMEIFDFEVVGRFNRFKLFKRFNIDCFEYSIGSVR